MGQYEGVVRPVDVSVSGLVLPRTINVMYGSGMVVLNRPAQGPPIHLVLKPEAGGPWRFAPGDHLARTFTIDNTTEIATATAHGFLNGSGPLKVSNGGGALPTGLSNVTPYYIHVIDADTFTLHLTEAEAIDGKNAVAVSDNGTGTQTIKGSLVITAPGAAITDGTGSFKIHAVSGTDAGADNTDWLPLAAPRQLSIIGTGASDILTYCWV